MVEGGWNFIWPAYALTVLSLGGAALFVLLRARYWAKQAKQLDRK
ncbi:MAG: heme exporter protein CcmD [Hyphomonadaceae bacterium]